MPLTLQAAVDELATCVRLAGRDWPGPSMTCGELDAIAAVLYAGGWYDEAVTVIMTHSMSDVEDGDPVDSVDPDAAYVDLHTIADHEDEAMAREFAQRYLGLSGDRG